MAFITETLTPNTNCDKCGVEQEQKLYRIALPSGITANICKRCAIELEDYIFGVEAT